VFCRCTNTHENTTFDVSTKKIRPKLLIVIGFEGENVSNLGWHSSPDCPVDQSHSVVTKIGKVGSMDEVIERIKFGVDWLIGAGSVGL
jgi:hypothetical protein